MRRWDPESPEMLAVHQESLDRVPLTCGPVFDTLRHLRDKYDISEDDYDFAICMITEQTKRLRRALVGAMMELKHGVDDGT